MQFIDPHFHYWDVTVHSKTGHNPKYLGQCGQKYPLYAPSDYIKDTNITGLHLKKADWVEALSDDPLAEFKWVVELTKRPEALGVEHAIVARALLHDPNVENLLKQYANYPSIKGIRQIINHHPTNPTLTWPTIDQDYLHNEQWKKGYALLAKYNFSFDLQLNPHQMKTAASFLALHPQTPVILDHLGSLYLGNSTAEKFTCHRNLEGGNEISESFTPRLCQNIYARFYETRLGNGHRR